MEVEATAALVMVTFLLECCRQGDVGMNAPLEFC